MKMLRKWAGTGLAISLAGGAQAAPQGTINMASPSGIVSMGGDGTNLLSGGVICGATSSAVLWAVCVNQAFVDATGHLGVIATQSGTWNITNITGTVTLPALAATSTLQPTNAAQGSTTSGQTGNLALGGVLTADPTYTTGQTQPLSMTLAGRLRTDILNPSVGATGSAVPGSAALVGARAQNVEPPLASNGNMTAFAVGLEGKQIILPYANKENMLRGAANTTGTSPVTFTGMGAQGAGIKIYVTGVQCKNTSAPNYTTPVASPVVTLNDSASTVLTPPAGSGDNNNFPVPLVVAANTALTFTPGTATTTIYCNAQGYFGS